MLAAPTDFVLHVVPGSCTTEQCLLTSSWTNNSAAASTFDILLDGGGVITTVDAPPNSVPGTRIDVAGPGYPTPVGTRYCVSIEAVSAAGDRSGPSNVLCFTLTPDSNGDIT